MAIDMAELTGLLPNSVMKNIIDFADIELKDGRISTRITIGHILTDEEKSKMKSERIIGIDCTTHHKYAPEIKYSYFYVV